MSTNMPAADLGPIISIHRCRSFIPMIGGTLLTVTGLALGGVYLAAQDVVFIGAAAMCLPGGLMMLWWSKVLSGRQVILHENGLSFRRGSQRADIPWREIANFRQESIPVGVGGPQFGVFEVVTLSGEKHLLDDQFQDIAQLTAAIHRQMPVTSRRSD